MDHWETNTEPLASDFDLRYQQKFYVENHVKRIFEVISKDEDLRQQLAYGGIPTFNAAASFRAGDSISSHTSMGSWSEGGVKRRRRNTRADRYCVRWIQDRNDAKPVVAIQYKAPHKLTITEICTESHHHHNRAATILHPRLSARSPRRQ